MPEQVSTAKLWLGIGTAEQPRVAFPAGRSGLSEPPAAAVSARTSVPPQHSAHLTAEQGRAVVGSADQPSGSSRAPGAAPAAAATNPFKQEACTSAAAAHEPHAQVSGSGCSGVVSEREAGRAQALQLQLRDMKQQLLLFAKWLDDPGWRQQQPDGGKEVRSPIWGAGRFSPECMPEHATAYLPAGVAAGQATAEGSRKAQSTAGSCRWCVSLVDKQSIACTSYIFYSHAIVEQLMTLLILS